MQICTGCRRHVRPADPRCPFCGETLRTATAVTSLGVAVLLGTAACGNGVDDSTSTSTSTSATGSSSSSLGGSETGQPTAPTTGSSTTSTSTTGPPLTTSAGELSTAGDEFVDDGGGSFYGASWSGDGGTNIECDVWAQDCPPGQKCSAYASGGGSSWSATKCVPVMPNPNQPGEPCMVEGSGVSGIDDCDLGSYCWDTDARNVGTCVALCTGTPDAASCEDPKTTCAIYNNNLLNLCLPSCDPLMVDCPAPEDVCINNPSDDGFLCVLDASGREGQQHDPCEYANSCDPGLLCLNADSANECDPAASGCCQPFCDLDDPDADAKCGGAGQVCNPYYEEGMAPMGQEHIGYCALPA